MWSYFEQPPPHLSTWFVHDTFGRLNHSLTLCLEPNILQPLVVVYLVAEDSQPSKEWQKRFFSHDQPYSHFISARDCTISANKYCKYAILYVNSVKYV